MEFNIVCNLCKKVVKGDPFEHLKTHQPLEIFTLIPKVSWNDFIEEDKTIADVAEEYTGVPLKKKPKVVVEEDDDEE